MKLYRFALLLLLFGAVVAGGVRYRDLLKASRPTPTETADATADAAPTEDAQPLDLALPAVPQVSAGDEVAEQAHIIPALAPRPNAFTTRTLPPQKITIPSIGLDARVIPLGTHFDQRGSLVWETAPFAVGHHAGSANPGESGNVVLSGHISSPSEGAIFQHLPEVKPGDNFVITTAQTPFLYRVTDVQVVLPSAVQFLDATSSSTATLITCYPDHIYSHRLIVRAQAV